MARSIGEDEPRPIQPGYGSAERVRRRRRCWSVPAWATSAGGAQWERDYNDWIASGRGQL